MSNMLNYEGESRKLGIELEFYGLSPSNAAPIVQSVTGGDIEAENSDLVKIKTEKGVYRLETDALFLKKMNDKASSSSAYKQLRDCLSFLTSEFVPTELVTPPLKIKDLDHVIEIQKKLSEGGGKGHIGVYPFCLRRSVEP